MTREPSPSLETLTSVEAALHDLLPTLPAEARRALVLRVGALVEEERQRERDRCAAICRERAALWRGTLAAESAVASAREEARARGNEALYLADLVAVASEPPASIN